MAEMTSANTESLQALKRNYIVPVKLNDMSIFDGAFTFMKQRFGEEMRRIDEEMSKFSKNWSSLYQTTVYNAQVDAQDLGGQPSKLENLTGSPLIEEDGDDRMLRLQFDVSQFEPEEINVEIKDNLLVVSAQHEEKSEDSSLFSKYHREFRLPTGINPESVASELSQDGVLVVRAPLNMAIKTN